MTHSHPLPFPVRDAADLKRAITYVMRARDIDRSAAQRYITQRARALGHTDMLPTMWGGRSATAVSTSPMGLDQQFREKSEQYGISLAKLKTVYFRGVDEYHSSDFDLGTPTMWGLARVQRFIDSMTTDAPMLSDQDLVSTDEVTTVDCGIDICVDASALIADVVYGDGSQTASMFAPAQVLCIAFEDDIITVDGMLDNEAWRYSLSTISGYQNLQIGDTVSL